ncbi:hypothetical protein C2I06_18630 [Niallia circulans]|nr:hypothetical protein C2I06_18630 [Niallia circulans]AYV72876.1 hypothetical protein C2H98_15745 [Niallia circulans]
MDVLTNHQRWKSIEPLVVFKQSYCSIQYMEKRHILYISIKIKEKRVRQIGGEFMVIRAKVLCFRKYRTTKQIEKLLK